MTTSKLNLTRDELATFLKSHNQIKQFERLFTVADEVAPASDTVGISIQAGNSEAIAGELLGEIAKIYQDLLINCAPIDAKANQSLDQLQKLSEELANGVVSAENKAAQALTLAADLKKELDLFASIEIKASEAIYAVSTLSKLVESLLVAPPPREFKRTRYGQFYDTTTQTAAAINTAYAITFNTTDLSSGVYLGTPTSRIYVDQEAVYNFQFSVQLDKTSGGVGSFYIWIRINGVDVPNSCSQVRIQGNDAESFNAANFFLQLKSGDYVQFMWAVDDVTVELKTFPATAFAPAVPSIIVTVSDNIEGIK